MTTLHVFSFFFIFASLLPLSNNGFWLIRGFDFPRLQLLCLTVLLIILQIIFYEFTLSSNLFLAGLLIAAAIDCYRIYPYTIFHAKESKVNKVALHQLKVLTANVRTKNKNYFEILSLADEEQPDIIFLLETDDLWKQHLHSLEQSYPHHLLVPQDNTYGMLFYSKLKLKSQDVKYLIDEKVPSVHVCVQFDENHEFNLIGVHPRPPRPKEGDSDQRDSELMKVAELTKELKHVIVMGDFNDVAWSHTTRLFKRMSQLLDPRIGRGFFNTFPTWCAPLRIPLDHFFHSEAFFFHSLTRVRNIGSDHFPLIFELAFNPSQMNKQQAEPAEGDDKSEAHELKSRGDDWDGPEEEVSKEDD